jgi:phosphoenolpyruvate-protein kinase (PTS system EI component)
MQIQGIPYVPGRAQGKLQRHIDATTEQDILILQQNQLRLLSTVTPAGLVVYDAAPYSHTMIQSLSLGIPLVILSAQQASLLPMDGYVQLDGHRGVVKIADPGSVITTELPSIPHAGQAVSTGDGVAIHLNASISGTASVVRALNNGAAAIGLVRSEFLQPADGNAPGRKYYQRIFTEICETAKPLTVTIRLLDLAPDKKPPWLSSLASIYEMTGVQGVRAYQLESIQHILREQLSAIDSLASRYSISLLIPYLTLIREFLHWKNFIKTVTSSPIEIGAMLETPAAVLELDHWLAESDFVSLGCNDLMQNLFAADRDLLQLKDYLNPYAPALLRFFHQAAITAGEKINNIQLCGLLPQWPGILPLLIGMGFTRFSVEPLNIPYLAQSVTATNKETMQPVIERVCGATSADEVCRLLNVPTWPHA